MPHAPERTQDFEVRRYLAMLGRRKVVIFACLVLMVAAAVGLSATQSKVYEAQGKILLTSTNSEILANIYGNSSDKASDRIATNIELMQSQRVKDAVTKKLGHPYKANFSAIGDTSVVLVKSHSTSPSRAAENVNVFIDTYITTQRDAVTKALQQQADTINSTLAVLAVQAAAIEKPVTAANDFIALLPPELDPQNPGLVRTQAIANRDAADQAAAPKRAANNAQVAIQQQRLDSINQALQLSDTGGYQIVSQATVPKSPVSPKPIRNGFLAAVIGLILGVVLALVLEQFDDTLRTKDDAEAVAGGRPVLGLIPVVSGWKDRAQTQVVSIQQPAAAAAEAYRTLRTSIQFLSVDEPVRTVMITSPTAGEGKTTTVANLGVAIARSGQRVAVVCCDLRRPRVETFFGMAISPGFTSVLLGDSTLEASLAPVPGENRLFLMPSGPPPPNPSELLSTKRARELIAELGDMFDVVLIDAPPVLPVTDALLLSKMVDATIIVLSGGRTSRRGARRTIELLEQVDARIEGTVLNGAPASDGYGATYGYRYGYAPYSRKGDKGATYSWKGNEPKQPKEKGRAARKAARAAAADQVDRAS